MLVLQQGVSREAVKLWVVSEFGDLPVGSRKTPVIVQQYSGYLTLGYPACLLLLVSCRKIGAAAAVANCFYATICLGDAFCRLFLL